MRLLFFGMALFVHTFIFSFSKSCTAGNHDIIITEIMADPSPAVGLPVAEFVEIYNRGDTAVDFSGWTFYEGSSKNLPPVVLLPGHYLIICAASDTALFQSYGQTAGLSSMSLTNSGEKIAIRAPGGIPVDSVVYSDEWLGASYKKDGGWSLERIDTDFTCHNDYNWTVAVHYNGGTPGTVNSVDGTFIDDEAPIPLHAYCPDTATIVITFSEPLDPLAVDSMEFVLSGNNQVLNRTIDLLDPNSVILSVSLPAIAGKIFTCTIKNVSDCPGNLLQTADVLYGIQDTAFAPDIIINEVLFNPPEGAEDFIELYNRGNGVVDMKKFTLVTLDENTGLPDAVEPVTATTRLLFPGEYTVLTESPEGVAQHFTSPYPRNFLKMENVPAMNVDEGNVGIWYNGKAMETYYYTEDDHFVLLNEHKGVSLERINAQRPATDKSNWHSAAAAAGYATPGYKNSQAVEGGAADGTGVIAMPEVFSPDNDGFDDIVTFQVTTPEAGYIGSIVIYHSDGQKIINLMQPQLTGTYAEYSWDGTGDNRKIVEPGMYIAVLQLYALNGNVKRIRLPVSVAAAKK